jgi:ubiquinone/menaquinone biosynthesis C-methylase UbiE
MKHILLFASIVFCASAQVAEHANQEYRTHEGREKIAPRLAAGPERDARQKPQQLVDWMGIKPGMTVADLGTGPGYMLPWLSKAVGALGKVQAEDIQQDFLDKAKAKASLEKLGNVAFVLGTEKDARLAAESVDVLLSLDAYHHFDYPAEMLASIRKALKPDGSFFLVEYYKDHFADRNHVRLDAPDVIREIESNGFRLKSRWELEANGQYAVLFVKK